MRSAAGFTVPEVLFVAALAATFAGLAIPFFDHAVDDLRAATAARYLAGRIHAARIEAITRQAAVALRFEPAGRDYTVVTVIDGNGNGVRSAEIASGVDRRVGEAEPLSVKYPDVELGLLPGVPDADGTPTGSLDGVRIGTARILTLSPDGTATSGTLYVRGRRAQYAVRVLGVTARTRLLEYHRGTSTWITR